MKIGIALGGGAAKGLAHIGILNVLREAGIEAEVVAGTSVGALVGAAYAAERLSDLMETARTVKIRDIPLLLTPTWSRQGLCSGKNFLDLLSDVIGVDAIEALPRRFAAVSVDLNRLETVTLTNGNLKQAIRASIAIPLLFTPVEVGDQLLVDGGTLEPVPVTAARQLGADFVIAVDLFGGPPVPRVELKAKRRGRKSERPSPLAAARTYLGALGERFPFFDQQDGGEKAQRTAATFFDIVEGTTAAIQRELTRCHFLIERPDFVIVPDVASVGILDFHCGEAIIELGCEAAHAALPALQEALQGRALSSSSRS